MKLKEIELKEALSRVRKAAFDAAYDEYSRYRDRLSNAIPSKQERKKGIEIDMETANTSLHVMAGLVDVLEEYHEACESNKKGDVK